jgi:hypothetical protein
MICVIKKIQEFLNSIVTNKFNWIIGSIIFLNYIIKFNQNKIKWTISKYTKKKT